MKQTLDNIQIIELIFSLVLLTIGIYFSYREFKEKENNLYYMWVMILVGGIVGTYIWIRATRRFFAKFIYFIVEKRFVRKIIAGGSFSYYGYIDPGSLSRKRFILDPVKQLLTLTIAFVGIAVFIFGIILSPDQASNPLIWGFLAIIVPIIATPLVPVLWALQDTNIKAYNKGNNTTWMVGKNYRNRYNSIITFGAIYANMKDDLGSVGAISDQFKLFLEVLRVGFLVMLISVGLFIIAYYTWFKQNLSNKVFESLSLVTYELKLDEIEFDDDSVEAEGEPSPKVSTDPESQAAETIIETQQEKFDEPPILTKSETSSHELFLGSEALPNKNEIPQINESPEGSQMDISEYQEPVMAIKPDPVKSTHEERKGPSRFELLGERIKEVSRSFWRHIVRIKQRGDEFIKKQIHSFRARRERIRRRRLTQQRQQLRNRRVNNYCLNCGSALQPNAKVCGACGLRQD